jgi:predicted transcriptional regulator
MIFRMERTILQGKAGDVLERLRKLLEAPGSDAETVQVTIEPVTEHYPQGADPVAAALQRGLAEADRGELIEHEKVLAWIDSLGGETELPAPKLP